MKPLFRRKANRFLVLIGGQFVPVASPIDDKPFFISDPPRRTGDDCVIFVEGQYRFARLIRGWLVDMGPA